MKPIMKSILSGAAALCLLAGTIGCSSAADDQTTNDALMSKQVELESSVAALSQQIAAIAGKPDGSADILSKQGELEEAIGTLSGQVGALADAIAETDAPETEVPVEPEVVYTNHAAEAYAKLCYIDKMLSDRDCFAGENFLLCQKWIHTELLQAGYTEADIVYQDVTMSKYVPIEDPNTATSALTSVTTDGKTYSRAGWRYVEDENGTYTKATGYSQNIIVTKPGKSEKTIIVAMHYDGTGTGDNGSGVALGLATAQAFHDVETAYTIQFVFLTGEEYGMYGASAYVAAMSEQAVADTLYMINMDSLVCGDYCYLYGGVQDNESKTVSATGAYDNAIQVADEIGLTFKSNPWTWDKLSPDDLAAGQTVPSYASPATGNWSDHAPFAKAGIPYLYMEATNWDIPDYTGYGETYLIGMLMNTENDYLDYIEAYFPGRPMHHLTMFSTLLDQLLLQEDASGIVG